jgi:hypothetical protein
LRSNSISTFCWNDFLGAEFIDHHRVVDDEIDGNQRVDLLRDRRRAAIASRIAARSTTAGTPVKSCISTRAGR